MSGELYTGVDEAFRRVRNELEDSVRAYIGPRDYGDAIVDLAVIPVIMPESILAHGGFRERRLIRWQERRADMRLHVDYQRFHDADDVTRRLMLIRNTVDSVRVIASRRRPGFDGERLVADILKATGVTQEQVMAP